MCEENKKCNCGCEEHVHEEEVVMLEDENGNQIAFHYITTMEYEGKEYVFLQPAEGEELDVLEIYELEASEEEGMDNLFPVEDELYETLYNQLMKDVEDGVFEGDVTYRECLDGCECDCGDDCDCDCDCDCHD